LSNPITDATLKELIVPVYVNNGFVAIIVWYSRCKFIGTCYDVVTPVEFGKKVPIKRYLKRGKLEGK